MHKSKIAKIAPVDLNAPGWPAIFYFYIQIGLRLFYLSLKFLETWYLTWSLLWMGLPWLPVLLWGTLEAFLTRICPAMCALNKYGRLHYFICTVSLILESSHLIVMLNLLLLNSVYVISSNQAVLRAGRNAFSWSKNATARVLTETGKKITFLAY